MKTTAAKIDLPRSDAERRAANRATAMFYNEEMVLTAAVGQAAASSRVSLYDDLLIGMQPITLEAYAVWGASPATVASLLAPAKGTT